MKTGLYVLQGVDPAQIAAAPFDVKVVEIYDDHGQPFGAEQVRQMGGGPGGALLLGYFSIGEAEDYRSYWNTIPASAIGPVDPSWPGNYEVKYWTEEWKSVARAEIDKMMAAGYDGAYFDVVDEFQLPWAQQNAPGGDAAAAMKNLIESLSAYAKSKVPTFKIWVNGGEELLTDERYLASIDGLFKENLFYNSDGSALRSAADTRWSLDHLRLAQAAGKDVVAIEYVSGAARIADVQAKADAAGMASYIARLDLKGVSLDGVRPGQVMHDDGLAGSSAPPRTEIDGAPAPPATDPKLVDVAPGSGSPAGTATPMESSAAGAAGDLDPRALLLGEAEGAPPDAAWVGSPAPVAGEWTAGDAGTAGLLSHPDGTGPIRVPPIAESDADPALAGQEGFGA